MQEVRGSSPRRSTRSTGRRGRKAVRGPAPALHRPWLYSRPLARRIGRCRGSTSWPSWCNTLVLAGCGGEAARTWRRQARLSPPVLPPRVQVARRTKGPRKRARARLPGPPGPTGPDAIVAAIRAWDPLVQSGVPVDQCRPLLDSVKKLGSAAQKAGGGLYVALYQGIAEDCLGQSTQPGAISGRPARWDLVTTSPPTRPATPNACSSSASSLIWRFGFQRGVTLASRAQFGRPA